MCKEASFVVTKDTVFWSKNTDSHEEIIAEHQLNEGCKPEEPNFVRVEISPANNDYRIELDKWAYRLDQDKFPKWYDASDVESRVRAELPDWMASKIVLPDQKVESVNDSTILAVYGTINYVYGSATINKVYGSATINYVCGSATIKEVCGSATIKEVYGSGNVTAYRHLPDLKITGGGVLIDRTAGGIPVISTSKG